MRLTDPNTYMRVVASILLKDIVVNVHQQTPGNLEPITTINNAKGPNDET